MLICIGSVFLQIITEIFLFKDKEACFKHFNIFRRKLFSLEFTFIRKSHKKKYHIPC